MQTNTPSRLSFNRGEIQYVSESHGSCTRTLGAREMGVAQKWHHPKTLRVVHRENKLNNNCLIETLIEVLGKSWST